MKRKTRDAIVMGSGLVAEIGSSLVVGMMALPSIKIVDDIYHSKIIDVLAVAGIVSLSWAVSWKTSDEVEQTIGDLLDNLSYAVEIED